MYLFMIVGDYYFEFFGKMGELISGWVINLVICYCDFEFDCNMVLKMNVMGCVKFGKFDGILCL